MPRGPPHLFGDDIERLPVVPLGLVLANAKKGGHIVADDRIELGPDHVVSFGVMLTAFAMANHRERAPGRQHGRRDLAREGTRWMGRAILGADEEAGFEVFAGDQRYPE